MFLLVCNRFMKCSSKNVQLLAETGSYHFHYFDAHLHTPFLPLKYGALLYQAVASFIVFSTSHFSVTIKTALPLHL